MEPNKNAPIIAKVEAQRAEIDKVIEDIKSTSNNATQKVAIERLTEARMWLGVRLGELGATQ